MGGLADLGRFSEPALHILISLAAGPKHGYAMQDDISELTGSRPGPGTLYGAVRRLEEHGYIEALPEQDRRKPYRLTDAGLSVITARITDPGAAWQPVLRHLLAADTARTEYVDVDTPGGPEETASHLSYVLEELTGIGLGAGLISGAALSRLLISLLYGIAPTDKVTYITVASLLFFVALVACWLPARRATKVDPMEALRNE